MFCEQNKTGRDVKVFTFTSSKPIPKASMGKGWADMHMVKGVFVRFGFGDRRTSQIHRQVKNKATRTSHVVYYIPQWLRMLMRSLVGRVDYILTLAWGFRRCSFQLVGQCEGLSIVERVTELAPRFLYVCKSKDTNR